MTRKYFAFCAKSYSLYEISAALTEDLRGRDITGGDRLFQELTVCYEQLTEAIRELEAEA